MYSCSFCGLMLPHPWDMSRNVHSVYKNENGIFGENSPKVWWKFTWDGLTILINFATSQVEPLETLARFLLTLWQCFTRFAIFAITGICFSGQKWYLVEKQEKTEPRLNGDLKSLLLHVHLYYYYYLFIYLFQTLLEQIKRRYGNNYSGLPFEKIKTTIGLNSKLNTISCY